MIERRRTTRILFKQKVVVKSGNFTAVGALYNISLQGACARFDKIPEFFKVGLCLKFKVILNAGEDEICFNALAQIVWFDEKKGGFFFVDVSSDDLVLLRRILELNTGDYAKIKKELKTFIKEDI